MITCSLKVHENVDDLYKIFLSETLKSDRAECTVEKDKALTFNIKAKDPVSMKAFLNSILKIIQTYEKTKAIK
jgi:tRNA threonylcarbamoyladenosine modification (KEOPS) complex  Pcc1 subunit